MSLLDDAQRHPITTILCVGAIAAFLAEATGRSMDHMVLSQPVAFEQPWRFLTTIFPHGGLLHIFFNLSFTWPIGKAVEERLGTPAMLILTLLSAAVASGAQLAFSGQGGIGLSGVLYAFAFFAYARGRFDPRFAGVIDRGTRDILIVWFFLCILLTRLDVLNIANAAHGGGAVIGFALGMRRQWLAPLIVALLSVAVVYRGSLPFAEESSAMWFNSALRAQEAGDFDTAIERYRRALAIDPNDTGAWKNLGISLSRKGDHDESIRAYVEVLRREPQAFRPSERAMVESEARRLNLGFD